MNSQQKYRSGGWLKLQKLTGEGKVTQSNLERNIERRQSGKPTYRYENKSSLKGHDNPAFVPDNKVEKKQPGTVTREQSMRPTSSSPDRNAYKDQILVRKRSSEDMGKDVPERQAPSMEQIKEDVPKARGQVSSPQQERTDASKNQRQSASQQPAKEEPKDKKEPKPILKPASSLGAGWI